jgi:hypothetical protein
MAVSGADKAAPERANGRDARPKGFARRIDAWALAGTALVALMVVLINYVSFRRYERWDLTQDRAFTLSERTEKVLSGLKQHVDIYVFMGSGEPTYQDLRELITRYKAKSTQITAHFVDPDREPTRFRVLSEKFGVRAGVNEDGQTSAELAVLVVSGDKRWVINRNDLLEVDFDSLEGENKNLKVKSVKTEQALSGALVQVTEGKKTRVCVSEGHGEWSLSEGGERGLLAVRDELKRENIEVESLSTRGKSALPKECEAIYVLGPQKAFSAEEAAALKRHLEGGKNVLLALDPVISGEKVAPTGLEELAAAYGVQIDADVVVELDEQRLLSPSPFEHFLVVSFGDQKMMKALNALGAPVAFNLARSLSTKEGSEAEAVLKSSDKGYGETGLAQLTAGDDLKPGEGDVRGPVNLGVLVDTKADKKEGEEKPGGRLLILGDSDWLNPRYLAQPELANIDLLSSVTGYLAAREALVAIAPRKVDSNAIVITEEGLNAVFLRVVVLLPLAVLVLGVGVWLQRKQ